MSYQGTYVCQLVLAGYRQALLDELQRRGSEIRFLVGDRHFVDGFVSDVRSPLCRRTGRNLFIARRTLAWQPSTVWSSVRARGAVVELNPRILTSWVILMWRRLLTKRTVGWGHADSRSSDPGVFAVLSRHLQQALCSELLVYTESERAKLRKRFPSKEITVTANAVYTTDRMQPANNESSRSDVVLIGRLVDEKRPILAINAFAAAVKKLPPDTLLHVVGVGPLASAVEREVQRMELSSRVVIHGEVFDPEILREVFARSFALLCGGYVGLNVVQALGFGVRVVYPDQEPHAPEVEALNANNSVQFQAGDSTSAAAALVSLWRNEGDSIDIRFRVSNEARARYSVERMADAFESVTGSRRGGVSSVG